MDANRLKARCLAGSSCLVALLASLASANVARAQTALFLEVARYSLDGFGSGSVLHVGDTTWLGGLMFEL